MVDSVHSALIRSRLYGALASGFVVPRGHPAAGQIPQESAEESAASLRNLYGSQDLADAWRRLQSAREAARNSDTEERLRDTYRDLFVNLHPGAGVPPYETEYTCGTNDFMKNQDLADLMGFYRAFGLDLGQGERFGERPDHLAVELEFLHFLCWKEARARAEAVGEHIEVCQDAQRKFLRDHVARWAAKFADRLEGSTQEEFFLALAGLLRKMVREEAERLGVPAEPLPCLPVLPLASSEQNVCETDCGCPFGE